MGNVIQAGNRMNPARQAFAWRRHSRLGTCADSQPRVSAPVRKRWPALLRRFLLGFADVAIAGGMENMDQAPYHRSQWPLGQPHGRRGDVRQHACAMA